MSILLFAISSLFFYARSKHFPTAMPDWLMGIRSERMAMAIVATICCIAGAILEMTYYGPVTGLCTALFWMSLWISALILALQWGSRALYISIMAAVLFTIIKIML